MRSSLPISGALRELPAEGVAENAVGGWSEGETSPFCIFLLLGFTMVIPIGGGDMPVIISFLNALSGLAAAFAGFAINNTVLVVSGCLVGASGLILTLIMCKAMNRTFASLLFKSFGGQKKKGANGPAKEPKAMSVEDAYMILEAAKNVVFVPGYGMAVAQAQHALRQVGGERRGGELCDSPGRRSYAGTHECSSCRGECAV
ncbi:MAG: NAD(P)(+) transhydrogenase (Re/Si-specific) subunit beta [Treponema sp.]|nr:NAD(P)(+) transhydrogenase (Re/Si-specific) subunit beta [Treponema sp.]